MIADKPCKASPIASNLAGENWVTQIESAHTAILASIASRWIDIEMWMSDVNVNLLLLITRDFKQLVNVAERKGLNALMYSHLIVFKRARQGNRLESTLEIVEGCKPPRWRWLSITTIFHLNSTESLQDHDGENLSPSPVKLFYVLFTVGNFKAPNALFCRQVLRLSFIPRKDLIFNNLRNRKTHRGSRY